MQNVILEEFNTHRQTLELMPPIFAEIQKAGELFVETIKNGNKIIFFGNGGSAADAQHIAAELSGRYKKERAPLAGVAVTTDTSALTAIGNDYGYDEVFARQVRALARPGDLLFGISTSGNSANVIKALNLARELSCKSIGLSGKDGGKMKDLCDANIIIPSNNTPRIQEMHILVGHTLCQILDNSIQDA